MTFQAAIHMSLASRDEIVVQSCYGLAFRGVYIRRPTVPDVEMLTPPEARALAAALVAAADDIDPAGTPAEEADPMLDAPRAAFPADDDPGGYR